MLYWELGFSPPLIPGISVVLRSEEINVDTPEQMEIQSITCWGIQFNKRILSAYYWSGTLVVFRTINWIRSGSALENLTVESGMESNDHKSLLLQVKLSAKVWRVRELSTRQFLFCKWFEWYHRKHIFKPRVDSKLELPKRLETETVFSVPTTI